MGADRPINRLLSVDDAHVTRAGAFLREHRRNADTSEAMDDLAEAFEEVARVARASALREVADRLDARATSERVTSDRWTSDSPHHLMKAHAHGFAADTLAEEAAAIRRMAVPV